MHGFCQMIYLVIMRQLWSLEVNDNALCNNWRIVGTWFALGPKKLGLGVFNRMIYWETNWETLTAWKVRAKELSLERLINQESIKV